jgi:hypothetical protein
MKFHPRVAPVKVGVMPLLKNKPDLVKKAKEVRDLLRPWMNVFYDDGGSIGRRYARQDEAGTPFCVTIDFDTLGEKPELKDTVTIRYRDDGRQERLAIVFRPAAVQLWPEQNPGPGDLHHRRHRDRRQPGLFFAAGLCRAAGNRQHGDPGGGGFRRKTGGEPAVHGLFFPRDWSPDHDFHHQGAGGMTAQRDGKVS